MKIIKRIKNEWNKPAGLPVHKEFTPLPEKEHNQMKNIFLEEVEELEDALQDLYDANESKNKIVKAIEFSGDYNPLIGDKYVLLVQTKEKYDSSMIEIADALGDQLYVLYNWSIQLGIQDCFVRNERLNTKHSIPVKANIQNIKLLVDKIGNDENQTKESFIEINDIINWLFIDLVGVTKENVSEQTLLYKILTEIHESNLSKMENGVFLRNENNKIIKGKNYYPPTSKIKNLLQESGVL